MHLLPLVADKLLASSDTANSEITALVAEAQKKKLDPGLYAVKTFLIKHPELQEPIKEAVKEALIKAVKEGLLIMGVNEALSEIKRK